MLLVHAWWVVARVHHDHSGRNHPTVLLLPSRNVCSDLPLAIGIPHLPVPLPAKASLPQNASARHQVTDSFRLWTFILPAVLVEIDSPQ